MASRSRRLQWGHRLSAMETRKLFLRLQCLDVCLQWGHRLSAMETGQLGSTAATHTNLQWGHRLSAMETRKYGWHFHIILHLQWGHRLSAMETPASRKRSAPRHSASMGPPPFGDGNRTIPTTRRTATTGFNGATAFRRWKLGQARGTPSSLGCFNGATAFRRWKHT